METVDIEVDGTRWGFWTEATLEHSVDRIGSIRLKAPFDPTRAEMRAAFRPFDFVPMEVRINDELWLEGTKVSVDPEVTAQSSEVEVGGYALPGVLDDCNHPGSNVPLEYEEIGLRALAEAFAAPYDVAVEFRGDEGSPFKKVRLEAERTPLQLLIELAKQRNLVISSTAEGALLCWKSVQTGDPVGSIRDVDVPVTRIKPSFDPQNYFSEVTGFAKSKTGRVGSKYTVQNPWLGRLRAKSVTLDDTDKADAPEATRAWLGRMFAASASWTVPDIPTWRAPNGQLWTPNTTILVEAPHAMIYRTYELLIRDVALHQTADKDVATLTLALPGVFSGEIPDELPWNE